MKNSAVLNDKLSLLMAEMGHTDRLAIADCGLPIPPGANRIDLALTQHIPSFIDTLRVILSDFGIEGAVMAEEVKSASPQLLEQTRQLLGKDIPIRFVSHEDFKKMLPSCKGVVRTGECVSYANIILVSTVTF